MFHRSAAVTKLQHSFHELEAKSVSIGALLITTANLKQSSKDFNKQLTYLVNNVLSDLFPCGLRVVTRSEVGRIHSHAAVSLDFEIPNFDWEAYDAAEASYLKYKETGDRTQLKNYNIYTKVYRNSMPEKLRKINDELKIRGRAYGFGMIKVIPVRKGNHAFMCYLTKNLPRNRQPRDKGVRFLSYWGLSAIKDFKVLTPCYNKYRNNLKDFCLSVGLTADNYMEVLKGIYGTKWHITGFDIIKNMGELTPDLVRKQNGIRESVKQYFLRKE